ncbi:flagellar hook-basal body protein [Sphingomonas adhaesiva]|uniref:flagellar hook-basal body protein n=1 Tax=Sphingomonas adhaesiva TaxID=28212 RepID=UPI002FF8BDF5
MSGAMEIAAIGLRAQQRALEAIAGNISNINTPAFKRSGMRFAALVRASAADRAHGGDPVDGAAVSGVAQWAQPMIDQQGQVERTGGSLDLAIDGRGFIELMGPAGRTLLWRGGTLRVLDDGQLAASSGLVLKAGITVPRDAAGIRIDRDGKVHALTGEDRGGSEIGQIALVTLDGGSAVERLDDGVYAVGDDVELSDAAADEGGMGHLVQGALERSNVDLNDEMVGMLVTQRAYAANAQVVRAIDEFLSLANGLRR